MGGAFDNEMLGREGFVALLNEVWEGFDRGIRRGRGRGHCHSLYGSEKKGGGVSYQVRGGEAATT